MFLVLFSSKTKQPKDTSMPYNCIKNSNFFSLNILEILDITTNIFLGCQLSFFALANIRLHRYNSFFRLILLLSVDINVNPGPTKVNNNKVPLHVLPFSNCDEPTINSKCDSSDYTKQLNNSKWNIFEKKGLAYFTFECQ